MTEKRQTSQDYIIRILQHFATKLWNITNFVMLFHAVMSRLVAILSRLVEIKILVNWGLVHWQVCNELGKRALKSDLKSTIIQNDD
jgi:hypothetical protein